MARISFLEACKNHDTAIAAYAAASAALGRDDKPSEAKMLAAYETMVKAPIRSKADALAALCFFSDNEGEVAAPAVLRRVARWLAAA